MRAATLRHHPESVHAAFPLHRLGPAVAGASRALRAAGEHRLRQCPRAVRGAGHGRQQRRRHHRSRTRAPAPAMPCGTPSAPTAWAATGTVSIQDLDCPSIAGMDNELSVAVLAGDGSCDLAAVQPRGRLRAAIQRCFRRAALSGLLPAHHLLACLSPVWRTTVPWCEAQCGFSVAVSGPGIDVVNVDFDAGPDVIIPLGGSTQLHASWRHHVCLDPQLRASVETPCRIPWRGPMRAPPTPWRPPWTAAPSPTSGHRERWSGW
jgi:hypothetical protein